MSDQIIIKGARLHNLKNVSLTIPKNRLVVFTGLSGSGKSTLVIDTLHKEGQRQFMESLGLVTDGLSRPQVENIVGLMPSISVDQHLTNHSPRSTVGTVTEVYTYLRVLFARLGHRPCPACGADIPPPQDIGAEMWDEEPQDDAVGEAADDCCTYPCPACGAPVPEIGMAHFSFNKPAGACPTCTGLGVVHQVDPQALLDEERSIADGAVLSWPPSTAAYYQQVLQAAGRHYGFAFAVDVPLKALGQVQRDLLLYGVGSSQFRRHYPDVEPPQTALAGRFEGVVTGTLRRYDAQAHNASYRQKVERMLLRQVCPDCRGDRLCAESRKVTVAGRTIVELGRLPLSDLTGWLEQVSEAATEQERMVVAPILDDLRQRIRRLVDVGAGYLSMDRSSPTLSTGEAQRLRLAALLGSGLTGVLYVLDEPTIGLHPRDTQRLIKVLRQLRDLGNTVLVIEHDLEVVQAADYIVDVGPGAGEYGGRVLVAGSAPAVMACAESETGRFLSGAARNAVPKRRRPGNGQALTIEGARAHNLQNVTVRLPLGTLIAVTGVSGSGKSSLMFDVLDRAARQHYYGAGDVPGGHDAIEGWQYLDKVVTIDQTAIGRTPRSNAATYTGAFAPIRAAFAATAEVRQRGLGVGHFSFNVPGGRCERCEGAGVLTVNMHFLPDVQVRCPACHGRRFRREVLAVRYHGRTIADVMDMTIEEACDFFDQVPDAHTRLRLMVEVGLGYLRLGQPATTLSGGEAQRVKLAKELGRRTNGRVLYLLDEPTTGLHPADVSRLLLVLQKLVDAGNTVVVVEHNLDVIKTADWVVDLGPEGGTAGGRVIAAGTPEAVARIPASYTGAFLRQALGECCIP